MKRGKYKLSIEAFRLFDLTRACSGGNGISFVLADTNLTAFRNVRIFKTTNQIYFLEIHDITEYSLYGKYWEVINLAY